MGARGGGIVLGGDLSETGWAGANAANRIWYLHCAALPAVARETPTVFPSPKEEMDPGASRQTSQASSPGNAALEAQTDAGRVA